MSVYPSVPALAASASVETSKQRYYFDSWILEKPKVIAHYANLIWLTASRFRKLSGQADCRNKNWSIGYCRNWRITSEIAATPTNVVFELWVSNEKKKQHIIAP